MNLFIELVVLVIFAVTISAHPKIVKKIFEIKNISEELPHFNEESEEHHRLEKNADYMEPVKIYQLPETSERTRRQIGFGGIGGGRFGLSYAGGYGHSRYRKY